VYEVKALTIRGEVVPLEISVSPYRKKGKIIGIEVIHRDISERKRMEEELRESEERFRGLYEGIHDPIAIFVGREGRLVDYNPAYKKLSGYTDEELKDTTYLSLVHPDDKAILQERYHTKLPEDRYPVIFEERAIDKKGEIKNLEVSVSLHKKKGKVIGVEAIHRDITERKAMEQKLQEYAEHLEEMVEARTRELKESQERLVKSERLATIGQLAAMVGHDLRNPLTGIKGAEYYLKTKWGSTMDATSREMFEVIEKDIEHSDKIITDLLEYSREIKLELKETTPKSMLEDALASIKVPENVQILEQTENKPEIEIDIDKMKRVFVNIIRNAIDAMPEGGRLIVKSKETNGNLEISFSDSGCGMSKQILQKIWTPLFTTKTNGIGLGLAICKRIVEAHGGTISVRSAIGKGTTFVVAVPVRLKTESGQELWVNVPKPLQSLATKAQ
jgi:two-component system sporulation sensor kinase A